MEINVIIIVGIWVFFMIEKITQTFFSDGHSHGHSHAHKSES